MNLHQESHPDIPKTATGWLLLFCLILTFVIPLAIAYRPAMTVFPRVLVSHSLKLTLLSGVRGVLFTGLAVLSARAGAKLWLIRAGAVKTARRFLWSFVLGNIGYFVLWILVLQPTQRLSFAAMGWNFVVGPIGFFAPWYTYLEHSNRVRETYTAGEN